MTLRSVRAALGLFCLAGAVGAQPVSAPTPPANPASDAVTGPAALKQVLELLRHQPVVRLRRPASLPGSATDVSMSIQIGENRYYQFSTLSGSIALELGPLERGWTTFRFFNTQTYRKTAKSGPVALLGGWTCTGGFEVVRDQTFDVLIEQTPEGLRCEIR
jgi:hypothetical protein